MSRPRWFVELVKWAYPGRFLAARATRLPLLGSLVERWLFDGDHLLYLPPNRVIPVGVEVPPFEEMVLPSQVVDRFIEQARTRWIMNACLCRDANGCRDYPIDLGCIFLGEAAAGINPALGRPVTCEEALEHARRSRDLGLVHLVGRNKLDTLWLGVGPGNRLLTICNCCPCCCLWKGMVSHVAPQIASKLVPVPGVSIAVGEGCTGCGSCARACFAGAISVVEGKAAISPACRACGRCIEVCPQRAIELIVENRHLVNESFARLSALVDVT